MNLDLNEIRAGKTAFTRHGPADLFRLEGQEGRFIQPIEVQVEVSRSEDTILVKGTITTYMEYACSRCLAEVSGPLKAAFQILCLPPGHEKEETEEFITYDPQGTGIDLTGYIREQVILAFPLKPLCREDCAGLCAGCGINLNHEPCRCSAPPPDPRWEKLKKLSPSKRV